jgi:glycosyltransferase involved in cell wall biosynthesis
MPRVSEQKTCDHPKVSVDMITYNHEKYIAEAIESVLMQETDFPVELVIGEDCSTDGTRRIVKAYAEKYPNVIRALLPDHNLGMQRNGLATLGACRGEYIACLEGDDLWTSPQKLAVQVKYLDEHRDCVICHTRGICIKLNLRNVIREFPPLTNRQERVTGEMLASGNFIATCSVMFRSSAMPPLGEDFMKLKMGDWPLWVLLAQHGWIGYLDQNMAAYRVHDNSSWSSQSDLYQLNGTLDAIRFIINILDPKNRGPWRALWKVLLLNHELAIVFKQARTESLPVIIRSSFNLVKKGATLRKRLVPWLVYGVAKALLIHFFCRSAERQPPNATR